MTRESLAPLSTALTPGASPRSYGTNLSWTAIPNCMMISGHSCDLTYYTLDPALRYYARVRAVSGNHTSPWQRTNSFSPQEGRSGVCLPCTAGAGGFEDGRGQAAKLLGENFGTEENRDVSSYLPGGQPGCGMGRDKPRTGSTGCEGQSQLSPLLQRLLLLQTGESPNVLFQRPCFQPACACQARASP